MKKVRTSNSQSSSGVEIDKEMLEVAVNLDDMNAETLPMVMELLFQAGATDVFYTPIFMKKGRPATKLSFLTPKDLLPQMEGILFKHTTTFGLRYAPITCHRLAREIQIVSTPFGEVAVKLGFYQGKLVQASPEYEDCYQLAEKTGEPLQTIYQAALEALKQMRNLE